MVPVNEALTSARLWGDWGFILVIVFVAGEVFAAIGERVSRDATTKSLWKGLETFAGILLVGALAMEFMGHKRETTILDSENAKWHLAAQQANERASSNELQVAKLQHEQFLLKSGWREISEENSNIITVQLKFMPPLYVKILRCGNSGETLHFIRQLEGIFKAGGCKVNADEDWPKPVIGVQIAWKNWGVAKVNGEWDPKGNPLTAKMNISQAIFNQVGEFPDFDRNLFVGKNDGVTNLDCDLEILVGESK